jgi:hypothetical protein
VKAGLRSRLLQAEKNCDEDMNKYRVLIISRQVLLQPETQGKENCGEGEKKWIRPKQASVKLASALGSATTN